MFLVFFQLEKDSDESADSGDDSRGESRNQIFQFRFHDALLVAEYERLAQTEGPYNNRDVS